VSDTARYIDADALIKEIEAGQDSLKTNNDAMWEINKKYYKGLCWAHKIIDEQPTADVAPRAEVAMEIFEEIEKTVNDCVVDESLFKPAYFEFRKFNEHLAELKKKYTEENEA
jgi:hypothetical protein